MTREKYFVLGLLLTVTSCGTILQNQATKNFKDPVTKTVYYKSLNKYQQDFVYLKTICEKYFPKNNYYFPQDERIELENIILEKLGKSGLTDIDFRLHLKMYLSNFNNQHTWISLKRIKDFDSRIYPFYPFNKDSSWYVLNLTKNYSTHLVGQRITAFNDVPIGVYEKKLLELVSAENEISKRKSLVYWWNRPTFHEFIKGSKIDSIKLTLDNEQTIWLKKTTTKNLDWQLKEKDLQVHPITKYKDRIYDFQIIDSLNLTYLQLHECYDKTEIKEGMKSYVKPWIRPLASLYINIQTNKRNPSKKLKKYFDPERPIFHEYISTMIREANNKGVSKLIIDLRNNNGGSEMICLQLLYHLTENENLKDFSVYIQNGDFYKHYFKKNYFDGMDFYRKENKNAPTKDSLFFAGFSNSDKFLFDKITDPRSPYYIPKDRPIFKGKVIIIADYSTHSAGSLFTALLQDNNIGQVIGTEVSNNPTGPTTWTPFKLPNSKIEASISSQYVVRPDSKKTDKFIPDIHMEKSYKDIINGRDPLFEKALEILNKE